MTMSEETTNRETVDSQRNYDIIEGQHAFIKCWTRGVAFEEAVVVPAVEVDALVPGDLGGVR